MPHVLCPSCGLGSYAVTPHSAPSLCPYCDADLFAPRRATSGAAAAAASAGDDDAAGAGELEAEAA